LSVVFWGRIENSLEVLSHQTICSICTICTKLTKRMRMREEESPYEEIVAHQKKVQAMNGVIPSDIDAYGYLEGCSNADGLMNPNSLGVRESYYRINDRSYRFKFRWERASQRNWRKQSSVRTEVGARLPSIR